LRRAGIYYIVVSSVSVLHLCMGGERRCYN